MACLPQLGSVPAAHAVVAGGCDWPLQPAVGLSNNDVIALRPLRCVRCVGWKPRLKPPNSTCFDLLWFVVKLIRNKSKVLSRSQTIDNVGQLWWAWFSFPGKSADEIVEP